MACHPEWTPGMPNDDLTCKCPSKLGNRPCWHPATQEDGYCDLCRKGKNGHCGRMYEHEPTPP